ncbi:MAG TPA: flagellar hook-basal body protein [Firmicutes bacterium]|nr:flagellar hook-basal body protein [Candidatus Fermentithermobacillaceae bacterium]
MLRGIISGVTAMRAQVTNQEVIANNLANVNTAAYNKDTTTFSSFHDVFTMMFRGNDTPQVIGAMSSGAVVHDVKTIRSVGPVEYTGELLDVALPGGVYFAVETPSGVRYTRRGDFEISTDGYLTLGGFRVLGRSGPVQVGEYRTRAIGEDGAVVCDGVVVDTLNTYRFADESALVKEGTSLFRAEGTTPVLEENPGLITRALEKSSVDPVVEMVNLIAAMRAYEAAQKAIQSHDETLGMAVERVGRV